MKKQLAIDLLGGTPRKAADAMGYKTIQAIYVWPETLSAAQSDRVRGALSRMKQPCKAVATTAKAVGNV